MAVKPLSKLTIGLHWIVALSMLGLFGIGLYMAETESYALYPWHKSFGIVIFPIAVLRIIWRLKEGWPQAVGDYPKLEQVMAKLTHGVLIVATILMPISGMVFSAMSGHGFELFGLSLVAPNHAPGQPDEVLPRNEQIAGFAHEAHEIFGWVMLVAVMLHVLGALKHHFIDKDVTLKRMAGKALD